NMEKRANVAIFASGAGSNFQAIMDSPHREFDVVRLVSDKPKSHVIGKAASSGVETIVFDADEYEDRKTYEEEILKKLKKRALNGLFLLGICAVSVKQF